MRPLPNSMESDEESMKRIAKGGAGSANHEGCVNVGSDLGLRGHRDMSSYHPHWVAQGVGYDAVGSSRGMSSVPQGLPAGSTRQGNVYVSHNGGVYDLEASAKVTRS